MRNTLVRYSLWLLGWLTFFSLPSQATILTELLSPFSFEETQQRIESKLLQSGMILFSRIDHSEAAEKVQMQLPKTLVLIYGNPKGGTPLMQKYPLLALDLPLRVLLREDSKKNTWVVFYGVDSLVANYNIKPAEIAVLNRGEQLIRSVLEKEKNLQ